MPPSVSDNLWGTYIFFVQFKVVISNTREKTTLNVPELVIKRSFYYPHKELPLRALGYLLTV